MKLLTFFLVIYSVSSFAREPVYYTTDLQLTRTGQSISLGSLEHRGEIEDSPVIVFSFKFNSETFRKMKIMTSEQSSVCSGEVPQLKSRLILDGDTKETVYENLKFGVQYELKANSEYSYEEFGSSLNCLSVKKEISIWAGNNQVNPYHVRVCEYFSNTTKDKNILYYLLRRSPILAYSSEKRILFDFDNICGKKMIVNSPSKRSYKQNTPTQSVEGQITSEGGPTYNFKLIFDDNLKMGRISCEEDLIEFEKAGLSNCDDLVLDGNVFK